MFFLIYSLINIVHCLVCDFEVIVVVINDVFVIFMM